MAVVLIEISGGYLEIQKSADEATKSPIINELRH